MLSTKRIVLEIGKAPALEGEWTVGEVQQAAEFLTRWLAQLRLPATMARLENKADAALD